MKAILIPIGAAADRSLPSLCAALSCGLTKEVPAVDLLRILSAAPAPLTDALLADLRVCHSLFEGRRDVPFFRTLFSSETCRPVFPDRETLSGSSELLLSALRGRDMPLSYRTDREAVEWAFTSLLESEDPSVAPLLALRDQLASTSASTDPEEAPEETRILLFADLCDGFSAGAAVAVLRFFRSSLGDACPFLGLLAGFEALGLGAGDQLADAREALRALSDRELIRAADDRPTSGADAAWLLSLPAALGHSEDTRRLLPFAAARILGEAFSSPRQPSAGLHTREIPGALSLSVLGDEARAAVAFLRSAVWCLSDLFPSLRQFFLHPALLRSLAPATRNGLFRRLFKALEGSPSLPKELPVLERVLKVVLLEGLSLLRSLPFPLREEPRNLALWQEAVKACGRAVTLASEYDVRRKEAADSGVDQVAPVHRVSMADTEEEKLLRQLDEMSASLSEALESRAGTLRKLGGFRARQALEDCRARCEAAEASAREKLRELPSDSPEERFALALQERRVRLLRAAIARCDADLAEACKPENLSAPAAEKPSTPFTGEILSPECAEKLLALLTSEQNAEEPARFLRDNISSLLSGFPLPDAKALLKNLLAVCRAEGNPSESPLARLLAGVFSVCASEAASLRFPAPGELPAVPLLPDLTTPDRFFTVPAAAGAILAPARPDPTAERRGLLALLLLRQYRRRGAVEASLCVDPCLPEDSVLSRVWLSSRGIPRAWIVSLRREDPDGTEEKRPFAVFLPGVGLEPAFRSAAHAALVPAFAYWFDRESLAFADPCPYLSEADRQILTELLTRLRSLLKEPRAHAFTDFLADWHRDIVRARQVSDPDPLLGQRLKAACGLQRLPAWQGELTRTYAFFERSLPEDALCARLLPQELPFPAARCDVAEEVCYAFRGMPFARENPARLLESLRLPEEATLLSSLNAECELLSRSSDDYHEALIRGLEDLLRRFPSADADALETANGILEKAREPITAQDTELLWPWDTVSSSVLTILRECLGKNLAPFALKPFSDRLAVFPARGGQLIGDSMLSRMCVVADPSTPAPAENPSEENPEAEAAPAVRLDAVLPPLGEAFADALCRFPEGRTLLQPGLLRFERAGARIRSVLTLEGAFTLRLVRLWEESEIVPLFSHDLPTLALWPSVPFRPEDWHAYFVYAHLPEGFRLTFSEGEGKPVPLEGEGPRFAARRQAFPVCFTLWRDQACLGSLPNLLPPPELPVSEAWTACLDFGSSASSVVFSAGDRRWPLSGPDMVRTLLRSPASSEALLWREFMPAVPLSPIVPGALRIFRNAPLSGEGTSDDSATVPFRDGSILLSASLRDVLETPAEALYTDLKWNAEKGRARGMYLHQLMLLCALQARAGGASALGWRAAVPDEMAEGGREAIAALLSDLALRVSAESGLPLPPKSAPVSFASESAALGAYFRLCAPDQTRGGFLLLDLGADTADISLFLRGRENAVRACQIPLGLHYMLLPALLRRPALLSEDFGFAPDPLLQRDLADLQALLESARTDASALRQCRYALDAFIADHVQSLRAALLDRRSAQAPGMTGALLLLHFGWLMMLSGLILLQLSEDPGRNDFLPEQMSLCLSGRGAGLIEGLTDAAKTSLWRLLTMFRNPKVSSLSLLFSAEKKLEIPVGLSCLREFRSGVPHPSAVPVSISVRPEELLPEFLNRFRREFPPEAALLFPTLYSNDPYAPFSPRGLQLINETLRSVFGSGDTRRPFTALAACLDTLLELSREPDTPPQA